MSTTEEGRGALLAAFDRIGGLPDADEDRDDFMERVEAGDALKIAYDGISLAQEPAPPPPKLDQEDVERLKVLHTHLTAPYAPVRPEWHELGAVLSRLLALLEHPTKEEER